MNYLNLYLFKILFQGCQNKPFYAFFCNKLKDKYYLVRV